MTNLATDVAVIGGGLIGLSTAMHVQQLQPHAKVVVVEKDGDVAEQQSGRNSGVLHAGIYYEPGSLKARYCVEGHRALGEFCDRFEIPIVRCGKVIVANNDKESQQLERLIERGRKNGVPDLRIIDRDELVEIEPHVSGVRALHAPHSAIVDYKKIASTYGAILQNAGGEIRLNTELLDVTEVNGRHRLTTTGDDIDAKLVINCAGLHSDVVANKMGVAPSLRIIPFRGEFFEFIESRRSLVKGLIYPVPNPALPFLGVHFTPRVDGSVDAGPNAVLATKREGYLRSDFSWRDFASTLSFSGFWRLAAKNIRPGVSEINRSLRKKAFVESLRRLMPEILDADLIPRKSGVRAMAVDRSGNLIDDFRIEESSGAIHVLNAPSPAATSSLMIGKHVANMADVRINAV